MNLLSDEAVRELDDVVHFYRQFGQILAGMAQAQELPGVSPMAAGRGYLLDHLGGPHREGDVLVVTRNDLRVSWLISIVGVNRIPTESTITLTLTDPNRAGSEKEIEFNLETSADDLLKLVKEAGFRQFNPDIAGGNPYFHPFRLPVDGDPPPDSSYKLAFPPEIAEDAKYEGILSYAGFWIITMDAKALPSRLEIEVHDENVFGLTEVTCQKLDHTPAGVLRIYDGLNLGWPTPLKPGTLVNFRDTPELGYAVTQFSPRDMTMFVEDDEDSD